MSNFLITELDDRIEFGVAVVDNDALEYNGTCSNGTCCGSNSSTDGSCTNNTNCKSTDTCCKSTSTS